MKFNERLKELRTEKGVTQKQLGGLFSFSKNTVCEWEKGRAEPKSEVIKKLADYFEVTTDYLLGRSDDFGNVTVHAEKTGEFLTDDEKSLIKSYRNLSAECKNQTRAYIEFINAREKSDK